MKTTMNYYVAERVDNEQYGHLTNLIKRCDTLEEAQGFIRSKMKDWRDEGLNTLGMTAGGVLWGAEGRTKWAYDPSLGEDTCRVVHMLFIFASPIFMAGGIEGL